MPPVCVCWGGVQPQQLFSPPTVLRTQTATCLEAAVLLCSLLIGADYQAFCVSGYASRELCEGDQTQQECPLLDKGGQVLVRTLPCWPGVPVQT